MLVSDWLIMIEIILNIYIIGGHTTRLDMDVNPMSVHYSCDARIGGCQQNRLQGMGSPFSQHAPIKRHSLPQ